MNNELRQGILPFQIEWSDEPLVARGGLELPYEMAKALRLPEVIDRTAAKVVHHAHQVLLKLAAPGDKIKLLMQIRRRCLQIACGLRITPYPGREHGLWPPAAKD